MIQCPMLHDDYVKFMKVKGISIDNSNSSDSDSKLSEFNSILDRLVSMEEKDRETTSVQINNGKNKNSDSDK